MAIRFKTDEEFEKEKDRLLELVVPHELHPDLFEAPRLTQDELAVLFAKTKEDVRTKMTICKYEQKILRKLRAEFAKYGINSLGDAVDLVKDREVGAPVKAINHS